jgi:PelA/Pel-15E family pectate lyase
MKRLLLSLTLALTVSPALAEPIGADRVEELTAAERPAWKAYLERSRADARADEAAVQAEVVANGMTRAVRAPSGGDFKVKAKAGDPWFGGDEAKNLADAILSFQTPSGGWSKHIGFSKGPRTPGMQWTAQNEPGQPAHYVATFDNSSTTAEMQFLANVWLATKRNDCKAGFVKGLKFILAAQYPNGGWPQVYPLEGGYHDDVTFNDDAMTHVLELLHGIALGEPCYAFLDEPQRRLAADALAKGVRCVLGTQIVQNGKKTAWCAQFDALTLRPSAARKMEPATLSGLESAHVLKFLMTLTDPTPEVVTCIESGLQWLEAMKVTGEEKTTPDGKTVFVPNAASTDVRWARFYDLKTSKPVFPGRDGILYETFEAMAAKNKVGYDYYTSQPGSVVKTGQKAWRKMLARRPGK